MPINRESSRLERCYRREKRWEELSALLIERSEESPDDAGRAQYLVQAAEVCETELDDADRAFILLLASFQLAPNHPAVVSGLPRLATMQVRWQDLLEESARLGDEASGPRRAEMLVVVAKWQEHDLGDLPMAEQALEEALAADPSNRVALERLVAIHSQREDWARVASYLAGAAQHAEQVADRARLLMTAAEIYRDRLQDDDAARAQLQRVLETSPDHPQAARALSELLWTAQCWTELTPLLEDMLSRTRPRLSGDMGIMHYRAGMTDQMLGDPESAFQHFQEAADAIPNHIPTWLSWAQLALKEKDWRQILVAVPQVLRLAPDRLSGAEQLEYLRALGHAHLLNEEPRAAAGAFARALQMDPDHQPSREGLSSAHRRCPDDSKLWAPQLIEQLQVLWPGATTSEERVEILRRILHLQLEVIQDRQGALKTGAELLSLASLDQSLLLVLAELYSDCEKWQETVEVLDRLQQLETGAARAHHLHAMADILEADLCDRQKAVQAYSQALDADPEEPRSFQRITELLREARDWHQLEHQYELMIARIADREATREPLLSFWRQLGELRLRQLADFTGAAEAFRACIALDPAAADFYDLLAEAMAHQVTPDMGQLARIREELIEISPNADAVAGQLHLLSRLWGDQSEVDKSWHACAGLVALGQASSYERLVYDREAPAIVPEQTVGLTEDDWQRRLCHAGQDWALSEVLATVSPALALPRSQSLAELGLEPATPLNPQDGTALSRLLLDAARLLGAPLPRTYLSGVAELETRVVGIAEGEGAVPALILGQDLTRWHTEPEVLFALGRKLAQLRPEHVLLRLPTEASATDLQDVLAAAVRLVYPTISMAMADPLAVDRYVAMFDSVLSEYDRGRLATAVSQLPSSCALVDLAAWLEAADKTADRAGLLCCGDVVTAVRELAREARLLGKRPEERILDLCKWATSSSYFQLRDQLGLTLPMLYPDDEIVDEPSLEIIAAPAF